ncbi:MAG: PBP1A family penicillin-binding protein [Actinomycetota bacterium]|nr:PBP1A family penicillin-binding protein [Actinomycetota bacterium]
MKVFVRILIISFVCVAIAVSGVFLWFYTGIGLPKISSFKNHNTAQNTQIFSANGKFLTDLHGEENREIVDLDIIPENLQKAVIAAEDSNFYKHKGIDWWAAARALWANVVSGKVWQGGSTITQQYVKNAYVGRKRTIWRKIQEASLAHQLEKKYSKDMILQLYLNGIYFGQGAFGCYVAAYKYFGKTPPQLTLAECATLAGIICSPSYYDPYVCPEKVVTRRNWVLDRMVKKSFVSKEEAESAKNEPLQVQPINRYFKPPPAPYFCEYIVERAKTELSSKGYKPDDLYKGGFRIYTTLDMKLQELAEETVRTHLNSNSGPDVALVCIDPRTGYIKAMVGGKNFLKSQFNSAADGHRQAGSAFKVFVLTRAIADGISPEVTYNSSSPCIIHLPDGGKWVVNNYDGRGSGSMSIRTATIHSVNCVFAQLIMDVGPSRVAQMAKNMGIMTEVEANPAIALGGLHKGVTPLEMASAFGTLANGGNHAIPRSIYKITDSEGNIIIENKPKTERVLDSKIALKVNKILQAVVSSGTGRGANIGRSQAGKTGTTEDHADAWFVGYTPDLVTAVWVGYPEGRISMGGMCGGDLPATIWGDFMSKALKDVPPTSFEAASSEDEVQRDEGNSVTLLVCDGSGLLATPYCPHSHYRTFRRGEEPTRPCNVHTERTTNVVPNVVGMNQSSAKELLTQSGYSVSVTQQSSAQSPGTVVSQTPSAGTRLAPGRSVTITVSSGPSMGVIPSVVGLSEQAAKTKISTAGFNNEVNYVEGSPVGVVIAQSPSGGTSAPVSSTVVITVNKAAGTGVQNLFQMIFCLGRNLPSNS